MADNIFVAFLRKLLAPVLLFKDIKYHLAGGLYAKLYAESGKKIHQSPWSQALRCITWMERDGYMNICK